MGVENDVRPAPQARGADILDSPAAGPAAIRGSALRVTGYAVSVALSVVSAALLTRHLGIEGFGQYTVVLALMAVVGGITEAGMTNIGIREYSTLEAAERDRLMSNLLGLRVVLTSVGVAAAVAFAALVGYDPVVVASTAVAGLGLLIAVIQLTYAVPLNSRLQLTSVTALEVGRQVILVASIVLLVLAGASLLGVMVAWPLSALVIALITAPLVSGSVPLLPAFDRVQWRRLLRITAAYAAATAVAALYGYVIVILTSLVVSERETGLFGASFRVFVAVTGATGALMGSVFPILARAARDDAQRLAYGMRRLSDVALVTGAGVAVCTATGAALAIRVVAGEEFADSIPVLQLQSAALVSTYLASAWGFSLLAERRHRALLIVNAVALAVGGAAALVLASAYDAKGAAVATVIGETVLAGGYAAALAKRTGRMPFDRRVVLGVTIAAAAALAVGFLPGIPDVINLVLAGGVFAALVLLLRALPPEVMHAIRRRTA